MRLFQGPKGYLSCSAWAYDVMTLGAAVVVCMACSVRWTAAGASEACKTKCGSTPGVVLVDVTNGIPHTACDTIPSSRA